MFCVQQTSFFCFPRSPFICVLNLTSLGRVQGKLLRCVVGHDFSVTRSWLTFPLALPVLSSPNLQVIMVALSPISPESRDNRCLQESWHPTNFFVSQTTVLTPPRALPLPLPPDLIRFETGGDRPDSPRLDPVWSSASQHVGASFPSMFEGFPPVITRPFPFPIGRSERPVPFFVSLRLDPLFPPHFFPHVFKRFRTTCRSRYLGLGLCRTF